MEDGERIADSKELVDPAFEMPGPKPGDSPSLTRPVDLEPLGSSVPEFVAPPEMLSEPPLPDPFEEGPESESAEEELPPLESAEMALETL